MSDQYSYDMKMAIAWLILGLLTVAIVYLLIVAEREYRRDKEARERLEAFKKRHGIY